jgi:hypothetical protein
LAVAPSCDGGEATVYHYYLTAAKATGTDTIYVVDATDEGSAACLVQRLGCGRITREQALQAIEDGYDATLETIAFHGERDAESVPDEELAAMSADQRARVARALRFCRRTGARTQAAKGKR